MSTDRSNDRFIAEANESMGDNLTRSEPAILTSYGLIGAILLCGAVGYLLDRWMDASPWFLLAGLLVGITLGFSRLYRLVRR
jgi:F0F1-type ATP synthase assembly protein I